MQRLNSVRALRMMFPNSTISEWLSPFISSSWGLSRMYIEGQKQSFLNNRSLRKDYTVGLIPGMHIASTGLLRGARLLVLHPKYFGPNPTIQCSSKAPIDSTAGKIRPLMKGIFTTLHFLFFCFRNCESCVLKN